MYLFGHLVNQTAIKWLSNEHFLTASSSAPRVNLWSVEGGVTSRLLYEVEKGKEASFSQVNELEILKERKLVMGGCEDSFVRLFDLNTGKVIKKLETQQAVGSVLAWQSSLVAGDHGGSVYVWDARTFRLMEQRDNVHCFKYDSGVTSLARSGERLLTAGADGIVKVFI